MSRSTRAGFLRIRGDVVLRWLNEAATEHEAAWNRRLNQWAMRLGRQVPTDQPALATQTGRDRSENNSSRLRESGSCPPEPHAVPELP